MPAHYNIDPDQRIVRSEASGVLTEQESWDLYERIRVDSAFDPTFCQICDLRAVTEIEASAPFLKRLASQSIFARGARRAFVAEQDYHYGLARMLQVYAETEGSEVAVFRTVEEAERWIHPAGGSASP